MKKLSLIVVLLLACFTTGPTAQTAVVTAFVGATIVDGTGSGPIENGVVLVSNGRITAAGPASRVMVPAGATRVDLRGKAVLPGFINAHGHVGGATSSRAELEQQLRLYGSYGVTSVFSLGGDGANSAALRNDAARGHSRLFIAGAVVAGNTEAAAGKEIDSNLALKVDWLKVRVDDNLGTTPKMAKEGWKTAIQRGHAHKVPTAAHVFYLDDAKDLLKEGVDLIAHSVRDKPVDAEFISLVKARDICVVPTLTREVSTFIYESTPAFFSDEFFLRHADKAAMAELTKPERQEQFRTSTAAKRYKVALEQASANLKQLSDAGVRIAMGTDTGPAGRFQGYFEHMELELMVKAGLTPMQAIKAATGDAARCMKKAGAVGTIQPGAFADLVVYTANPAVNIRNSRTIESVWISGEKMQ